MKQIFISIISLLVCASVGAQSNEALLKKLSEAPDRQKDLESLFKEDRLQAGKQQPTVTGVLTFKPGSSELTMVYDNKEYFAVEPGKVSIKRTGNLQVFDTKKNIMMRDLSETLIAAFNGEVEKIAQTQNADIKAVKEGGYIICTLTARKKAARGYNSIIAKYDIKSGTLRYMKMSEFNGNVTSYSLTE